VADSFIFLMLDMLGRFCLSIGLFLLPGATDVAPGSLFSTAATDRFYVSHPGLRRWDIAAILQLGYKQTSGIAQGFAAPSRRLLASQTFAAWASIVSRFATQATSAAAPAARALSPASRAARPTTAAAGLGAG